MNEQKLFDIVDLFYGDSLDFHSAARLFGADGSVVHVTPAQLRTKPTDHAIREVLLEIDTSTLSGGEPFVAGVVVNLRDVVPIRFDLLVQRFGPFRELPRLKPTSHRNYQFLIRGLHHEGYLLVFVEPTRQPAEIQQVHGVTLRRFRM